MLWPRRGCVNAPEVRAQEDRPAFAGIRWIARLRALASAFRNSSPAASKVLCDSRDIQGVLGSKRLRHPDAFGRTACIRSRCRNHVGRATRHGHDAEGSSQPRSVRLSRQDCGSNRGGPLPPRKRAPVPLSGTASRRGAWHPGVRVLRHCEHDGVRSLPAGQDR